MLDNEVISGGWGDGWCMVENEEIGVVCGGRDWRVGSREWVEKL